MPETCRVIYDNKIVASSWYLSSKTKHLYNVNLMSGTSFCSHKERMQLVSVILLVTNKPFLSPWRPVLTLHTTLWLFYVQPVLKFKTNIQSAHKVHSYVMYGSQNKYRLFPPHSESSFLSNATPISKTASLFR